MIAYNRLLVIITIFAALSLIFLYMHLGGDGIGAGGQDLSKMKYLKYSILDRLCVGQDSDSVLCRQQEVHGRGFLTGNQEMKDDYKYHHHHHHHHRHMKDNIGDRNRGRERGVARNKQRIIDLLANNKLTELQGDIEKDTRKTPRLEEALELDTFYKNLTTTTAAAATKTEDVKSARWSKTVHADVEQSNDSSRSSGDRNTDDLKESANNIDGQEAHNKPSKTDFLDMSISSEEDRRKPRKDSIQKATKTTSFYTTKQQQKQQRRSRKPQNCNIPVVDPFHREALPYITYKWKGERCTLRWRRSRVGKGGILHVTGLANENVRKVSVSYIKRVDDEVNKLEKHFVYDADTMPRKGWFTCGYNHFSKSAKINPLDANLFCNTFHLISLLLQANGGRKTKFYVW